MEKILFQHVRNVEIDENILFSSNAAFHERLFAQYWIVIF